MLYWECKRRLGQLRQFREVVRSYFQNTTFDTMGRRHAVTDLSELRKKINVMIPEVVRSSFKIGNSLSISYTHPGYGVTGRINVIENLFSLDRQQIPVSKAFDYIDRVIGEYDFRNWNAEVRNQRRVRITQRRPDRVGVDADAEEAEKRYPWATYNDRQARERREKNGLSGRS